MFIEGGVGTCRTIGVLFLKYAIKNVFFATGGGGDGFETEKK